MTPALGAPAGLAGPAADAWRDAVRSRRRRRRKRRRSLREVRCDRWGNPLGEPYARYPFGVLWRAEATFGAVTIPAEVSAGWFVGSSRWADGEFYRARITQLKAKP